MSRVYALKTDKNSLLQVNLNFWHLCQIFSKVGVVFFFIKNSCINIFASLYPIFMFVPPQLCSKIKFFFSHFVYFPEIFISFGAFYSVKSRFTIFFLFFCFPVFITFHQFFWLSKVFLENRQSVQKKNVFFSKLWYRT